ncbi:MAG: RNA polymerase sigma factor [Gammaproteobacteria bacterium]
MKPPPPADEAAVVPFPTPADSGAQERAEENEWLLRVKHHADRQAFRALFERLTPRLHGYLRRDGVAPTDAEHALQDVWLVVWRKAGQFDPTIASARTWIFTLVRNRLIDIERAARRERRLTGAFMEASRDAETVEPDLLAQAIGARMARVLAQLPPEQQDVVLQCYVEGRSQREIAQAQGIPLGTVKSRARLAFERLKQLMEGAP